MNGLDIIIIILLALWFFGAVWYLVRRKKSGKGCCGGGCSGNCSGNCSACRTAQASLSHKKEDTDKKDRG